MKFLLTTLLLLNFAHVQAGDKIITIDSNNQNDYLRHIPQLLMATFVDQGFKQTETSKNIWNLKINNLRCDSATRDASYPNESTSGLPSVKCFVNASVEMEGKGKPIQESRYVENLLSTIERYIPDSIYTDCVLGGRCAVFVKEINCTIDLNKEEMHDAYSCTFFPLTDSSHL